MHFQGKRPALAARLHVERRFIPQPLIGTNLRARKRGRTDPEFVQPLGDPSRAGGYGVHPANA